MKKISKITIVIAILSITFFVCNKDNQIDLESENFDLLSNKVTLKSSTNSTSIFFRNLGVSNVIIETKNEEIFIKLNSVKTFNFRGAAINLSDYSVKFNGKEITLNEDERFKIGLKNNKAYLLAPSYRGFYGDANLKVLQNVKTIIFS